MAGIIFSCAALDLAIFPGIARLHTGMLVTLALAIGIRIYRYPWLLAGHAVKQLPLNLATLGLDLGSLGLAGSTMTVALGVLYSVALFKMRQMLNDREEDLPEAMVKEIISSVVNVAHLRRFAEELVVGAILKGHLLNSLIRIEY